MLTRVGTAAGAGEEESGNPLAVRIMSYGKYQDAAWTHLPQIGVHYLFMAVPPVDQVDATLQKLKEHHLTALVLRGDADLTKPTCVDDLASQCAVCEKMGVKYMFLSAKRQTATKEEVYERLRKAGDAAKQHGVIIVLETHPDLGTNGDVQVETMKAINHPNVRVNFDTGNITYYNQGADAVAELTKSVDYLATVELKDHDGQLESWTFPPVGQGKVDMAGILRMLKEHHFTGPVTLEFEGIKGVELSEAQTKQAIAESVAYVRSLTWFR